MKISPALEPAPPACEVRAWGDAVPRRSLLRGSRLCPPASLLGGFPMFASHFLIPGVKSLHFFAQQIYPPGLVFLSCPPVQAVPLNKGHCQLHNVHKSLQLAAQSMSGCCWADKKIPGSKRLGGWRTLSSGLHDLPDIGALAASLFSVMETTTE